MGMFSRKFVVAGPDTHPPTPTMARVTRTSLVLSVMLKL